MKTYSTIEIKARLQTLPGWTYNGTFIEKTFLFPDFNATFGFMSRVALLAEAMGHHPDWSGGYNRLCICLRTHDLDGISALDFEFAERVEGYFK